jgi:predicted AlkP superfamily phosphohydrolase/phosphomutase
MIGTARMTSAIDRVLVIVFDGLRPDMITPALMPNLTAFAATGTWFREARSVFPSMTRVATTSIATGAPPSVHGIMGNTFYFPTATRDYVLDCSNIDDLRLAEQSTEGRFVACDTFADRLAAAGKKLAVVHTGSTGSTYLINPRARANGHWTFTVFGPTHTETPEAVEQVVARFGALPERTLPRFDQVDYATRVLTEHVLRVMDPDVALIWFNEPDTSYHHKFLGSEETLQVMRHVDAAFGRIVEALNTRPDRDRYAVLIASDHGQISSDAMIDMAHLLTAAGHATRRAADRTLEGCAVSLTGGNMGEIRVLDGDRGRRDRVAAWLREQDFIGAVFSPDRNEVEGQAMGTFALSLVGLDHERQPDLMYVLRSSEVSDPYGLPGLGLITGGVPVGGGMHGGLNRFELNTTLIAVGSPFTAQVDTRPVSITDIAPTILDLLRVPVPATITGCSLAMPFDRDVEATALETGAEAFRQRLSLARTGGRSIIMQGGRA